MSLLNEAATEAPTVAPTPGAGLVVARWNSWVRVYFPETEELRWFDLAEVGFEPAEGQAAPARAAESDGDS